MKVLMDKLAENIRLTLFSLPSGLKQKTRNRTESSADVTMLCCLLYNIFDFTLPFLTQHYLNSNT